MLIFVDGEIAIMVTKGRLPVTTTAANSTVFVDEEVTVEEKLGRGELIECRGDGTDAVTERRGEERATETERAGDDTVDGSIGGRPVELEKRGVKIIGGTKQKVQELKA